VAAGVLAVLVLAAPSITADAQDVGAAVDLGRIEVDEPLQVDQRYVLPTLRVRNPGSVTTEYRMVAQSVAGTDRMLDGGWVTFSPATFTLEPGERQPVEVVLRPAGGADAGEYEALLAAQVVSSGDGTSVAAAAASSLTFTVETPANTGGGSDWWLWLLLFLVALVVLRVVIRRIRSRYRLEVVRR
jgi:MYXO-CTERM domain-containing protein